MYVDRNIINNDRNRGGGRWYNNDILRTLPFSSVGFLSNDPPSANIFTIDIKYYFYFYKDTSKWHNILLALNKSNLNNEYDFLTVEYLIISTHVTYDIICIGKNRHLLYDKRIIYYIVNERTKVNNHNLINNCISNCT